MNLIKFSQLRCKLNCKKTSQSNKIKLLQKLNEYIAFYCAFMLHCISHRIKYGISFCCDYLHLLQDCASSAAAAAAVIIAASTASSSSHGHRRRLLIHLWRRTARRWIGAVRWRLRRRRAVHLSLTRCCRWTLYECYFVVSFRSYHSFFIYFAFSKI